jgi:DNA repair protein RadA/Sms
MAKLKSAFFCQECGYESPKWLGKCPSCGAWNSMAEEPKILNSKGHNTFNTIAKPIRLGDIPAHSYPRLSLGNEELDRILGGGMVPGSLMLLGGEPGIGKSTLALQIALLQNAVKVLYVTGEESEAQIKLRADRVAPGKTECTILCDTQLDNILTHARSINPNLIVIDSIQTMQSSALEGSPGSVGQIRECTAQILHFTKEHNISVLLIGHITKEGSIAGPKILEHMVDVVLQFEGDQQHLYRILRAHKNRFGSTSELGIYEMVGSGLREVKNPSESLLAQHQNETSGTAVGASMEGARPLLIEIQALVSTAVYGTPQRVTTGFDMRRLNMLLAVLEKRAGFKLATKDVFLNIAGGIRINDPGIDLAVIAAIMSSNLDISIPAFTCFAAEVGLTGEIRPAIRMEQRISEARRLGFKKILIAQHCKLNVEEEGIQIVRVDSIERFVRAIFTKS